MALRGAASTVKERIPANIPFDHDEIFGAVFTVDLAVEMIPEGTRLVLVNGLGKVRQELGDLQSPSHEYGRSLL